MFRFSGFDTDTNKKIVSRASHHVLEKVGQHWEKCNLLGTLMFLKYSSVDVHAIPTEARLYLVSALNVKFKYQ